MMDELVRALALGGLAVGLLALVLGGFVRTLGGAWDDGGRRVVLRQYGFILRGDGYVDGGKQVFKGVAAFGFARLTRYDFGAMHLGSLGFRHEQWPALHGQTMGHFHFRLRQDRLVGRFFGRRFSFVGAQLHQSRIVSGVQREWTRLP